ncbi:UNVERIFIED_CONTAM: hypothetical protein FKN15_076469 [Acipenser sinensis]
MARPSPVEELCTLRKNGQPFADDCTGSRSQIQRVAYHASEEAAERQKDNKGSVFFKSMIPGKRQASFQHECKGNTINSKFFSINKAQFNTEVLLYCLEKEKEKWLPLDGSFILSVGGTEYIIQGRGLSAALV